MHILGISLQFLFLFCSVRGQLFTGCLSGWVPFENSCYMFERDVKLIFEEANAQCWVTGSTLLTINSNAEHQFVSNWLLIHEQLESNTWFTSGTYQENRVYWDDGTYRDDTGNQYWLNGIPPRSNIKENGNYFEQNIRIAYVRSDSPMYIGYIWTVVSPSVPSAYICELPKSQTREKRILERTIEYGHGSLDADKIEKGPDVVYQPGNVVIYPGTPSVYIECGVVGNPLPNFRWKRNNEAVSSATDSRYTMSGSRFTIQKPDAQKDRGDYQCVAENKYGTVMSDPASMIFGYLQDFPPVKLEDVRANKFEGTRISCQAPSAFPEKRYSWYMKIQDEMMPIFLEHQYIFSSYSGYLYFSEVQPTDNRMYYCMVTLSKSSFYREAISQPPSKTSVGVWLVVSGTEHPGTIKPFIYNHVYPSTPVKGSRIRIECIAYGSLPLTYTWYREDGRPFVKGTHFSDLNRVLTIEEAGIEAEGNYVCHVRGAADVTTKIINLIIEAKPYFPFGIGDKYVDPGQTLHWRCMAVARPRATYTWYKDGKVIENIPGEIEVKGKYLLIQNIDEDRDSGMYQCAVTNVHGTTFSSGQLKVLSFPPNFNRFPLSPVTMIPLGGNYTIPCRVEGAPLPEVVWLKNGGQLSLLPGDDQGRIGMSVENDLLLAEIQYSDQGLYTCKAANINGEAANTTNVQVIRGISIQRPPLDTRVMVNRTAFMFCQASYDSKNFDLTYQWKFNGHLIDLRHSSHFVESTQDGLDGLYIIHAQFEHTGTFTCEAKTPIHTVSASARLFVYGPPSAPAGTYVESTSVVSDSVRLVWTVTSGMTNGSPITKYDIEAELGYYPDKWELVATDVLEFTASTEAVNFGLRPDQRTVVITGLLPNIDYRFRVRAVNMYGKSQATSGPSASKKTPATKPVVAVKNVRGVDDAKVGTLMVVWDPLDISEQGGPEVGYEVFYRRQGDPKDYLNKTVMGADASEVTVLVGEKNYYLPYSVKVRAYNKFGAGPNTTEHTIMSAEGMPIAAVLMGDCDNYNGTAFSMSWTPVEDTREIMKGRLKGYRVRYWHIDSPEWVTYRDLYGQHDSTVIIGLVDNNNYWASVQVMNYAGVGPLGEDRLAETFHLPPQQYPRHVRVFSHSKHSVRVTWQGISTAFDEETLQGYIVRVWKVQEDIRTATDTVVDKVQEAIVENLQAHTVYVMRVLGHSIGGEGALSPHVYFTVDGGNIPFDPVTTNYCFDASRTMCDAAVTIQTSFFTTVLIFLCHLLLQ